MSKFNRVASMGSKSSKYGNQRSETFDKGDKVIIMRETRGIVVKCTSTYVIVNVDGFESAYTLRYVELDNAS
jgi:hypothetical protein